MSILVTTIVQCDGWGLRRGRCESSTAIQAPRQDAQHARKEAAQHGWSRVREYPNAGEYLDLCPGCTTSYTRHPPKARTFRPGAS